MVFEAKILSVGHCNRVDGGSMAVKLHASCLYVQLIKWEFLNSWQVILDLTMKFFFIYERK